MKALVHALGLLLVLLGSPLLLRGQSSDECLACHSDTGMVMERQGREVHLYVDGKVLAQSSHQALSCADCHQGFDPAEIPHAKTIRPVSCDACHETVAYAESVHGQALGTSGCADCHGTHNILSPQNPDSWANRMNVASSCGKCHRDEDTRYSGSRHGVALTGGIKSAPSCVDCHGAHSILPTSELQAIVYKTKEPDVCLKCHLDDPQVRQDVGLSAGFIADYKSSIHGVALAGGNLQAPSCSDCHGAHDVTIGSNPQSHVSKFQVPDTCGKCHTEIAKTFYDSIHGTALRAGNQYSPNCTDCHGEHQILAPADPRSRVAEKNVAARVCAVCHSSVPLTEKYGLDSERFGSFEDSYHGLASKEGSVQVANCASCHGYHNIKPSSDPTSTINKQNLPQTCGKCHLGANENFTRGQVHLVIEQTREPVLYWVRTFYIALIVVTIGGMLLHNLFDFIHKSRFRFALRRGLVHAESFGPTQYLRMSLSERIQHAMMAVSFIVLVITGFMLKFPEAWWVVPIRQWSERLFEVRSITHRIAGVIMIAVSFYHLYYVLFKSRGKKLIRDLLPRLSDFKEFRGTALYYMGLAKSKPKYARFSYIEKAEYWALIWGVVVMGATGIILWFNDYFIGLLTLLGWNVAETIHYYEAWLATLAILVWHFYFVIFNPSVYPLNTACISGKLTEEEMAEEHPRELEEILSAQMKIETGADSPV